MAVIEIERFLEDKKLSVREGTYNSYKVDLQQLQEYILLQGIKDFREGIIQYRKVVEQSEYSSRTKYRKIFVLKSLYEWLGYEGTFDIWKLDQETIPTTGIFSHEQINKLMQTVERKTGVGDQARSSLLFELMLLYPVALKEVIQIELTDLNRKQRTITIGERKYPMTSDALKNKLKEYLKERKKLAAESDRLFLNKYGRGLSIYTVYSNFNTYLKEAKLPEGFSLKSLQEGAKEEYFSKGLNFRSYLEFLNQTNKDKTEK